MDSTPTLPDVIRDAMDTRLDRVWTAEIGQVVRYDSDKRVADVQILAVNRHVGEDGAVVKETIAPCPSVPVIRLGGGPFRLAMPVQPGDQGLLVFCGTPVGNWQIVGGAFDAGLIGRAHHLEGAVFLCGLAPMQASGELADSDAILIGSSGGPCIRVSEDDVQIGATSALVPKEHVLTATDGTILLGMWSDPGVVAGIAAAPVDGGTSLATAITAYLGTAGTPSGSTVLKAQR